MNAGARPQANLERADGLPRRVVINPHLHCPRWINIYRIGDPTDRSIVYVGQTVYDVHRRFAQHHSWWAGRADMNHWFTTLEERGTPAFVEQIDRIPDVITHTGKRLPNHIELEWIRRHRELGHRLFNSTGFIPCPTPRCRGRIWTDVQLVRAVRTPSPMTT